MKEHGSHILMLAQVTECLTNYVPLRVHLVTRGYFGSDERLLILRLWARELLRALLEMHRRHVVLGELRPETLFIRYFCYHD
jgi:hypothetical protein